VVDAQGWRSGLALRVFRVGAQGLAQGLGDVVA
jgi:hypothetical protein